MAFSSVTITFSNDWVNGDKLNFSSSLYTSSYIWTWVTTRSSGYEVTTGTPTANAGETSAINYKAAFDLDYPTGYTTVVQNTNEVKITSTTAGEVFYYVGAGTGNTGTLSVDYDNDGDPPDLDEINYMLTRSPYYVNVPFYFDTTTQIDVSLYIWDGDIASEPATATRTLTKVRPTINYTEFNLDLANAIRDYLDPKPTFDFTTGNALKSSYLEDNQWIKYVASYTDTANTIADLQDYLIAVDGFGYYSDGVNPTVPTNLVMTNCQRRKVSRDSYVLLPFINNGTITSIGATTETGEINYTPTLSTNNNSDNFINYVFVDVSGATTDNYLTIEVDGTDYVYEIVDECRYTPKTIVFKNQYGAWEIINMFKKEITRMNVDSGEFVNNYISAGTYDVARHEKKKINISGQKTITLNSGYIDERENTLYEELLLSDQVYFYESTKFVPVNVATQDLEFKTRINDSLVKYTIEFEYAYNEINRV